MAETDPVRERTIQFLVDLYRAYLDTLSMVGLQRTLLNYLNQRATGGQENRPPRQEARLEQLLELAQETQEWTAPTGVVRLESGQTIPYFRVSVPLTQFSGSAVPPGIQGTRGIPAELPDYLRGE